MMYPFVQAKNYSPANRTASSINLIVIHDMEATQGKKTAEDVANYFAGEDAPMASAHMCFDENSAVRCVHWNDIAYAAPNANTRGYHLEHAGFAKESRGDWLDDNNRKMLELSAQTAAERAKQFNIRVRHMTVDHNILAAMSNDDTEHSGFVGHIDVSRVSAEYGMPGDHSHTDPGENFPWGYYIDLVKHFHNKL